MVFWGHRFLPKNRRTNSTLLLWYLRSTCFPSFFGGNRQPQKTFSKLTDLYVATIKNRIVHGIDNFGLGLICWPLGTSTYNILSWCFVAGAENKPNHPSQRWSNMRLRHCTGLTQGHTKSFANFSGNCKKTLLTSKPLHTAVSSWSNFLG